MKKVLLSFAALAAVTSINAQIVNGDLESWTSGEPDNWMYDYGGQTGVAAGTNNFVTQFGEAATTTEITGTAAAGGTGSSAELETKAVVPGGTLDQANYTEITGMLLAQWPYTGTPLELTFDFNAMPATNDTAIVQVVLLDGSGNAIGFAGTIFDASNATTQWTSATIPFQYISAGTVTTIEVWAQSSYADAPVIGSVLQVDNFAVQGVNGVTELEFEANAYPNPATSVLNFDLDRNISSVSVIAMDGQVVSFEEFNGASASVNVANLKPGMYFYEVKAEDNSVVRNTFVKK